MAHKTLGKKAREDNNGWEYNLLGKNNLISKIFYDFFQGVAGIQDGKLKKWRQKHEIILDMLVMIRLKNSVRVHMLGKKNHKML